MSSDALSSRERLREIARNAMRERGFLVEFSREALAELSAIDRAAGEPRRADPIAVHDIQTIVAGLRHRGIGVLISDHNVEQTLDIVDRAYIMFDGQVKVSGTVRELVFDDTVAKIYLGPTLTARLRGRYTAAEHGGAEPAAG